MEAIILAGGFGTRLRDVVNDVPKPMAPIAGRPFLEILLSSLSKKGFSRVVLSLGYMSEKISDHFGGRYDGLDLVYVVEDLPLGTGGAARLASTACIQDHVFIFNGDTFLDLEVAQVERHWKNSQHSIVIARTVSDTSRYGRLLVDGGRVIEFCEKGMSGPGLINAGCYVMAKAALDHFPMYQNFSIETDFFLPNTSSAMIEVFETKGIFIDIGIPEDYLRAQTLLADR